MNIFFLWLFLRTILTIFAGWVSSIRPSTPIEISVPFFPPSLPIAQWLERVLISPWMRWDALWYERIVTHGYSATDGTAQFHPLYPWLSSLLAKAGLSPAVSLIFISSIATVALYYSFIKLAQIDLSSKDTFFSLMLLSLAPPAFVLFAPYSEALFILLSILSLYFMRKKAWWLAGIMGGLATLTRQQGIFLIFPMAWELWEQAGRNSKIFIKRWKDWLPILLIVLGMVVWLLYRAIFLSDLGANFSSVQQFIYSTIISPSANQVVTVQEFVWPWQAIYYSIEKVITQPDLDIWVNIILGALFLAILAVSWKKMRLSYRIYSLVISLVSFSYYTGPIHPYMGLPRHLLLGFPVLIGFTSLVNKSWLRLLFIALSGAGMLFLLALYVLNAWVP